MDILSIDDLSEAMPSFSNVLDDAWLGSSLIATSDDSLVVRDPTYLINEKIQLVIFLFLQTCGYRLMRNISIDRYDTRGACFKISSDRVNDMNQMINFQLIVLFPNFQLDVSYYDFCERSSETELLHEGSALCQSGLSLAYIPTGGVRLLF